MAFYFSGSHTGKLDDKNRLVLPQEFRYGLVENGELEFVIAMGMGGCLTIYRKSEMDKLIEKLRKKQHIAKYRKFFTLFFATMATTSCDKVGRFLIPQSLKEVSGLKAEVVLVGVMDRIELWPQEKYKLDLEGFLVGKNPEIDMSVIFEEIFSEKEGEEGFDE